MRQIVPRVLAAHGGASHAGTVQESPHSPDQTHGPKKSQGIRRTCPQCGERVPAKRGLARCPQCGVDMNSLLRERRYAVEPPDHRGSVDLLLKQSWWGPLAVVGMGAFVTLSGWLVLRQDETTPIEGTNDMRVGVVLGPVIMAHGLWVLGRNAWMRRRASAARPD